MCKCPYLARYLREDSLDGAQKVEKSNRIAIVVNLIIELLWGNQCEFPIKGKHVNGQPAGNMPAQVTSDAPRTSVSTDSSSSTSEVTTDGGGQ